MYGRIHWPREKPIQPPAPKIAILAPTYQNVRTLPGVLGAAGRLGLPIIVVDDGCHDGTAAALAAWQATDPAGRHRVTHVRNHGKAAALRAGFARARELGFTHVATCDTDGQHDPADLPRLLAASQNEPAALILGMRPRGAGYPARSYVGRTCSNALLWLHAGVRVRDSQSGMRVYPLALVDQLGPGAGRYAFETEILARAGWANVPIREVPIQCIYDVPGGRTSSFRPMVDSLRAVRMHARLLARSLYLRPVRKLAPVGDATATGTLCERFVRWLSPARAWRLVRADAGERQRFAASVGWGLFMAYQPFYGFKTLICLGLARAFRLQPVVVLSASSLCTPPIGPVLGMISIAAGHFMLHGAWPHLTRYPQSGQILELLRQVAGEWLLGAAVLGIASGSLGYLIARSATRRWLGAAAPAPAGEAPERA